MTCPECGDRLQQWLDGWTRDTAPADPPALCAACAEWAAAAGRLDRGLRLLTPPSPPPLLADRIVTGLAIRRRRARRRRLLLWTGAAAAAAVVLVVAWSFHRAGAPVPGPAPEAHAPSVDPGPAPVASSTTLRESVEEAGSAVASLTRRTADETVGKTGALIPPMVDPAIGKIDLAPPPFDAPTGPLREAGRGVSAGLEPVADSARRAVGLFLHELPPMQGSGNGGL